MDLEARLAALKAEAGTLVTKAANSPNDFTEAEGTRATELAKEISEVEAKIKRASDVAKALGGAVAKAPQQSSQDPDADNATPGDTPVRAKSAGQAFVTSQAFQDFKKAHPNGAPKNTPITIKADHIGGANLIRKASTINSGEQGNARAVRTGEVDDLVFRPSSGLLDLITTGTTNLDWFQYRQIISKTNNASIVPEAVTNDGVGIAGGVKPLSTLTTTTAEARGFTYADGMEVTNKELSDDGIMSSLIDATLTENVKLEIENVLLNGAGTADEPAGLFNTAGVLQQAFVTDAPTSIRKAITKLSTTSGAPIQGVLLNPEDDEAWDLMKDSHGDWIVGPYGVGPSTAWGHRRIISQAIPAGQAVIGDFRTIFLLELEALSVVAFNQHKDYAQRNLTYVRAEQRAVQLIRNAARLCIVDLTAGV